MASKIGRLKAAGTSGWKTPEGVSTRMEVPCSWTTNTWREEEVGALWQSGHWAWAAARASKSTGGGEECGPAGAEGTGDPEGTFTPVDPLPASLGPLLAAVTTTGRCCEEGGGDEVAAGRNNASATTLAWLAMCLMHGANSAINEMPLLLGRPRVRTPAQSPDQWLVVGEHDEAPPLQHLAEVFNSRHHGQ